MSGQHQGDAIALLALVSNMGSGIAESIPDGSFLPQFLPLADHARALDPNVLLVIGDRGAGKTELFQAIQIPEALAAIVALGGGRTIPKPNESRWLVGYSGKGAEHLPELVFRDFSKDREPSDLQILWLGLLIRSIIRQSDAPGSLFATPWSEVLSRVDLNPVDIFDVTKEHLPAVFSSLDRLDKHLNGADRWFFVSYDELDRVGAGDWAAMKTILRGLVQFWSSYARRWSRIRPKIFLRRDLFERAAMFGPDVSKIASQRVELLWTHRSLYTLLIKRLMNLKEGGPLREYLDPLELPGIEAGKLGWCPSNLTEPQLKSFVDRLCGQYMGASANKGVTFKWIPNHLQDSNGRVLPRSIVRLFEGAAEIESVSPRAEMPRLIHHSSLRAAVDQVSLSRVQELEGEEFPWIKTIRAGIGSERPEVPIERSKLERILTIDWTGTNEQPPEKSGRDLLKLLMELGIFYLRDESRVDVRDLYMKGFGFRRRGGVAQSL